MSIEMRTAFCDCMIGLAENKPDVVLLDADLMAAMGTKRFQERFPDRTVNCGIMEANMIGVAAGMSALGYIPFAHTFASFASRRAYDQIYLSGAYSGLNIKVIGSDPGITATLNGGTHMPFEDMGTMCGIPGMTVVEPTDIAMLKGIMEQIAADYGMHYMRLVRKGVADVYEEGSVFEIGKAVLLREGTDVAIIASGYCVAEALRAADALAADGISARVLNMFTWKPLDMETLLSAAVETGAIVTAENHNTINGLGSMVAGALAKTHPVPIEMIGAQDVFGEVGQQDYLAQRFGMTAAHIADAARTAVKRKQGEK